MEMNTVRILRQVGLLETLAFRFSDDTGRWSFEGAFNWGKGQKRWI